MERQHHPPFTTTTTTTSLWLVFYFILAVTLSSEGCPKCYKNFDSLSCSDPPPQQRYTLKISNYKDTVDSGLTYKCHYSAQQMYFTHHKGCNFSTVQYVLFMHCPMPHVSFAEILTQLGVIPENILELTFRNAGTRNDLKIESWHLNGLPNLTNLKLINNLFTSIPADLLKGTPNLEHFLFTQNNVSSLPETLFANTPKLVSISLLLNNLKSVPENIFNNNSTLVVLRLYGNILQELNPKLFSNIPQVYKLELSDNALTKLSSDTFKYLPKLQHLYLTFNDLESLPEDLFHNNPQLYIIHLSNNRLRTLPSGLFVKSKNVSDFDFQRNQVTTIPQQLFEGMHNLTNLIMPSNHLSGIPKGTFKDLVNLEKLLLQNNPLKTLPENTFDNQRKVKIINLTNTSLTHLPESIFKNCQSLEELDLGDNHLTMLKSTMFPHPLTLLHSLQLGNNNLTFSAMTSDVAAATEKTNKILMVEYFPLTDQVNLTDLILNNNRIQVLPHALRSLNKLRHLDLKNNSIENLDYHDFLFRSDTTNIDINDDSQRNIQTISKQVVKLELRDNPLICDCNLFKFTQLLQDKIPEEEIDNIRLQVDDKSKVTCSLPSDRNTYHLVTTLDISTLVCHRECSSCTCITRPHDNMFIVECHSQKLQRIPSIKSYLPPGNHYITLDLTNNSISNLEDLSRPEYFTLVNLTIPYNDIKVINQTYLPRKLQALDIRGNKFTHLRESVINYLNVTNPTLILDGNPWLCDCQLVDLHTFLRDPRRKLADSHSIMCDNVKKPLLSLSEEELCPTIQQPKVVITIVATTVFLVIFFVVITMIIYKYQQSIKVWLFTHQMCLWFVAKEEAEPYKKFDAFISYADKDEEYVNTVLVPGLECEEPKYKVCLQNRDWLPGDYIQNQINQSIEDSHRTIILLSPNFIENVWGQIEFKTAHCKALKEKGKNIIVIVLGKIPPESQLDDELKLYITTRTYLQSNHPKFWQHLRYAMPHPHEFLRKKPASKTTENLQMVQTH